MASAQIQIQPIYETMFSEVAPSFNVVYHPNCRLPKHLNRSFNAVKQSQAITSTAPPDVGGKDRYKYSTMPLQVPALVSVVEPALGHADRQRSPRTRQPVSKSIQTLYRESSAQTIPWQPDAKVSDTCEDTPEVLFLDKMFWGPPFAEDKYRTGDLPVDFHTTEIINKMRHTRKWTKIVEHSEYRNAIISDLETGDWVFREAEIDELQNIRLELVGEEVSEKNGCRLNRVQTKLHKLWRVKKEQMNNKVDAIRRNRDRELRKLKVLYTSGGREGVVERLRTCRGGGDVTSAAAEPDSELHAPSTRHGLQARCRNAAVTFYPDLLDLEERAALEQEPAWLRASKTAARSAYRPRFPAGHPCDRETKYGEHFLKSLHESLIQARLGAGLKSAGPCTLLVPRKDIKLQRPTTPEAEALPDKQEDEHQAAVLLQRTVRGRAVQMLMAEGCARATHLIAELRTTHGLRRKDRHRVEKEQIAVRDLAARELDAERREYEEASLAAQLTGTALAAALTFLEKELWRLREERRQHAFILVAKREKEMREAAEAGRRQLEEQRRHEHDLMFKQVLGVTHETVDAYLQDIISDGTEACAAAQAEERAQGQADEIEREANDQCDMSTLEQSELVAELVHQLAIPEVERLASRQRIQRLQRAGLQAVRRDLFGLLDSGVQDKEVCVQCGNPLNEECKCAVCPLGPQPREVPEHRDDPRWRYIRKKPRPEKDVGERYPPHHDLRCMLDCLVDEVVAKSRTRAAELSALRREAGEMLEEKLEMTLDVKQYLDTGPDLLPLDIRRGAEMARQAEIEKSNICFCEDSEPGSDYNYSEPDVSTGLLPSQLRALQDLHRCKCSQLTAPSPSPADSTEYEDEFMELYETPTLKINPFAQQ